MQEPIEMKKQFKPRTKKYDELALAVVEEFLKNDPEVKAKKREKEQWNAKLDQFKAAFEAEPPKKVFKADLHRILRSKTVLNTDLQKESVLDKVEKSY